MIVLSKFKKETQVGLNTDDGVILWVDVRKNEEDDTFSVTAMLDKRYIGRSTLTVIEAKRRDPKSDDFVIIDEHGKAGWFVSGTQFKGEEVYTIMVSSMEDL